MIAHAVRVQGAVAEEGPPGWDPERANRVKALRARSATRSSIPAGDPVAAARSIREVYSGDQPAELVRLLSVANPS